MAENHRPPGTEVVDIAVAIRVSEPGSLRALNKRRFTANGAKGPDGGVDSAGEETLCALLEGLGTGAGLGAHDGFSIEGGARRYYR